MFPRLDPGIYHIQDDREFLLQLLEATRVLLVQGAVNSRDIADKLREYAWLHITNNS